MHFLTVGTQLPFDRLVSALDEWAARNRHVEITAQIGNSRLQPKHMRWKKFMAADEFRKNFESAETIVAHSGMGTILTSLDLGKPVVIVPRLAARGEHRNDHQLATVKQFAHFPQVHAVEDVVHLGATLDSLQALPKEFVSSGEPSGSLVAAIRRFITHFEDTK